MPEPTCVKCGSHDFIAHPVELEQCERPLLFVLCSACGGVVGVLENVKIVDYFQDVQAKLLEIESSIPAS